MTGSGWGTPDTGVRMDRPRSGRGSAPQPVLNRPFCQMLGPVPDEACAGPDPPRLCGRDQWPHLPGRIRLGHGDRELPSGRRGGRGRPRALHLGHLQPRARPHRRWHRRRRGLRSLSPLPRRRGAHGGARDPLVPLLDRMAAGDADRGGSGQRRRTRLLQPPGRRVADPRHRAARHALPLGSAAAAARCWRLDQPRHRRPVRGLRRRGGQVPGRPRADDDNVQRTVVRGVSRALHRGARARRHRQRRRPRPSIT